MLLNDPATSENNQSGEPVFVFYIHLLICVIAHFLSQNFYVFPSKCLFLLHCDPNPSFVKDIFDELSLLNKMIRGDVESLRLLFDKYYDDLCQYVNMYINQPEIAEEIVQDVFVYIWEKRREINITHSIKAYLFKVSKNKSLNYLRSAYRRKRVLQDVGDHHYKETLSADHSLEVEELRSIFNEAVNQLPPRCKEIFILSREQCLTYNEIANQLNLSVKTVENQMSIALGKLRDYLQPYYPQLFSIWLWINFF